MDTLLKAMLSAPQDTTEEWLKKEFYIEYSDIEKLKFEAMKAEYERKSQAPMARIPKYDYPRDNPHTRQERQRRHQRTNDRQHSDNTGPRRPNFRERDAFFRNAPQRLKPEFKNYNLRQLCCAFAMNGFVCGNEIPKDMGGAHCRDKSGIVRSHTCACGGRHPLESCRRAMK